VNGERRTVKGERRTANETSTSENGCSGRAVRRACTPHGIQVPWLKEQQKISLPGKTRVMLRAGPGILGFLERLSAFVRFQRFGNLIPPFIIVGTVIASAKGRRDQDKANQQRAGHKI